MIAIEMARRAIPAHVRPSFDEMEKHCKKQVAAPAAEAAPAAGAGKATAGKAAAGKAA